MVSSLRWVLPIDEGVFQWLQFHRTCSWISASRWIDPVVRVGLALLVGFTLVRTGCRAPRSLAPLVLVFIGGLAIVELLKTAIERLRPNSFPGPVSGNSFPSGHTMGAAMAAGLCALMLREAIRKPGLRGAVYVVAAGLVLLQALGRLVNGSHWLSDVVASVLLGFAWALGAGALRRLPRTVMGTMVTFASLAFFIFNDLPATRFELPSALDESRPALVSVEFGTPEARTVLGNGWEDGPAEPVGPVSWATAPDVSATLRIPSGSEGILKITLRPATSADNQRICSRMVVSVNAWRAPEICLVRGWREYHLEPPAGTLHAGDNRVRFQIVAEAGLNPEEPGVGLAAFRYIRLYPRA
jgi:membrane-associated phospholipid phosphatase